MPTLLDSYDTIGQGSYESPSVFNFYLVEFAHPGAVQDASLTSPETSLYQSCRLLYLLDALSTTVKFGVNDCPRVPTFEGWKISSPFQCSTVEGNTDFSPAHFSYWPSSVESVQSIVIVSELSLLLTSSRLTTSNKALITSLVQPIFDTGDISKAIRAAQQYILTTPEAHTTGIARISGNERQITGYESKPRGPYKALVFLNFAGKCSIFPTIFFLIVSMLLTLKIVSCLHLQEGWIHIIFWFQKDSAEVVRMVMQPMQRHAGMLSLLLA
jgi:hypothetical protein